jgi:hypothetical protein
MESVWSPWPHFQFEPGSLGHIESHCVLAMSIFSIDYQFLINFESCLSLDKRSSRFLFTCGQSLVIREAREENSL